MRSEVRILSGAMLLKIFTSGPIETHSILIADEKAVIFDAPLDCTQQIVQALEEHSLKAALILLTHSHWDHIADAAKLKKTLDVPLYIHAEDAPNLEKPGSDHLPLMFPIKGVKPDGYLTDGQKIETGGLKIEVIHTPGHTPGSVCFYLEKEKILVSGDTLFKGGMGRLDLPTSRPDLMPASLKKLTHLPPKTRVFPGHGDETTIEDETWVLKGGFFDE
jgi:hydroxyacylglutathione hydrolase